MTETPRPIGVPSGEGTFPVLPLRDIVVFPHMIVPLFVGREKSINALEEVMRADKQILLATQKDAGDDDPSPQAIYEVGTLATVLQLLKLPDGTVKVLVEGRDRAQILRYTERQNYFEAEARILTETVGEEVEVEALARSVVSEFENYVKLNKKVSPEVLSAVSNIEDYSKLADTVASHLAVRIPEKQEILALTGVAERLEKVLGMMESEISVLQVEKRIRSRVKRQMEKTQREYYLNEQMKAIQKELGDGEDGRDEMRELEERIAKTKFSKEAREKAETELKKLRQMSPMSAEATVVRNYLDWLLGIPWKKRSKVRNDLALRRGGAERRPLWPGEGQGADRRVPRRAEPRQQAEGADPLPRRPSRRRQDLARQVDRQGDRPRVRAHVARRRPRRGGDPRPPAHLYRLDARQGRPVDAEGEEVQPALPARRDRQDGHGFPRRSVVGAARGARSGAELDVHGPLSGGRIRPLGRDVRDDGEHAQHSAAADGPDGDHPHRRLHGGREGRDRAAPSACRRSSSNHGLKKDEFEIDDEAMRTIIRRYTREAGVRNLERELSTLSRKVIKELLTSEAKTVKITPENLEKYLGVTRYRYGEIEGEDQVGVVTGLAWTEFGGELLTVEGVMMPGKGRMTVTGNLRDVMKESISAAASYVRSRAIDFGIKPPLFDKRDIHVHVPEGATPKDGPSAGIAMVTAIVSVMTGIPARKDVAMTGEITLRGRVLPIGGLKEKLLAAHRGGIKTVLIPEENAKDLAEIPDNVKSGLEIIPVAAWARCSCTRWCGSPSRSNGREAEQESAKPAVAEDDAGAGMVAH